MLKAVGQVLFSSGLQNPKFTAGEKKAQDYEIRTYHPAKWVSTTLSGMQGEEHLKTGFRRLFNYIQGNNKNKIKVDMTAPVTCHVVPRRRPGVRVSVHHLLLPARGASGQPPRTQRGRGVCGGQKGDHRLRLTGGFSNENMKREELLKLLESLKRDGVEFVDNPYYTAGYDSPFKLTNRRNEVWVLKNAENQ
ncbi:Heme-binding protein 2 [Oryzias melastigma]|uniref:Heme-binding protein 2 n=1 Tax=Oryzias melastigma TaxID=30732 RepID=A0A834FNS6_ORYME|nr:Heme-binding protein 2 [Oryzias melastigma]